MRFYQLHRLQSAGESAGYEFFRTKRQAEKAKREWLVPPPDNPAWLELAAAEIKIITVTPTRAGIVAALNRHAAHADNG
jgi:hypothetical protein